VIELKIKGDPVVEQPVARPEKDGCIVLRASDAEIHGGSPVLEFRAKDGNIGFWQDPKDWVAWKLAVPRLGEYDVEAVYSCEAGAEGSPFAIEVDGSRMEAKTVSTGTWDRFVARRLGTVRLRRRGVMELAVKPGLGPWRSMGLARILLRPGSRPRQGRRSTRTFLHPLNLHGPEPVGYNL
jgi:hypothetical protein